MSLVLVRSAFWSAIGLLTIGMTVASTSSIRLAIAGAGAVVAAGAIAFGILHQRPRRPTAWWLFFVGVLASSATLALASAHGNLFSLATYAYTRNLETVLVFVPLTVGLLALGRSAVPSRNRALALDVTVVALAGSLLVWLTLTRPLVTRMELAGTARVFTVASVAGCLAALVVSVRVALGRRANLSLVLLAMGALALLTSDVLLGVANLHGWPTRKPAGLAFLAFCGLSGTGALTRAMPKVTAKLLPDDRVGVGRLTLLVGAMLVAPTALLTEATAGPVDAALAIAIVSAATGILVLARLYLLAKDRDRRIRQDTITQAASEGLATARSEAEVVEQLRTALEAMLPPEAPSSVRIENGHGPVSHPPVTDGKLSIPVDVAIGAGQDTRNGEPVASSPRTVSFAAPTAHLLELSDTLSVLAQQAAQALRSITVIRRLQASERETYFRTLVITSSEAILVSRGDRVNYASPSAVSLIGCDPRGRDFGELVLRSPLGGEPVGGGTLPWLDFEEGAEAKLRRADGRFLTVVVRRRDLTDDPTVNGVVTTIRDVTAEREAQRVLAYKATHDKLTGLVNAEQFHDDLRTGSSGAVLIVDLDGFGAINTTHGREVAERILVSAARRIRSCVQPSDVAARLGDHEFGVLVRDVNDVDDARRLSHQFADVLAKPTIVGGGSVECHATIGAAVARTSEEHRALSRHAHDALDVAKASGKRAWRVYDEGMARRRRSPLDDRRSIAAAIRHGALRTHYQPIIELATGITVGFEALIRPGPNMGTPPPTALEIVEVAEESGVMTQLGNWVISRALADVARLNSSDRSHQVFVSVNVSPQQLRHGDFVDHVCDLLTTAGADPSLLVLEVTEHLPMDSEPQAWDQLTELHNEGIRIAIDDYGTGQATLGYLSQPCVDIVKFDRALVSRTDGRMRTLLAGTIAATAKLGVEHIAEGIEEPRARDTMLSIGCRYGQGYLYSAAMPIDDAVAWTIEGTVLNGVKVP